MKRRSIAASWAIATAMAATVPAADRAETRPIEVIVNGGFEQGPVGLSKKGWQVDNAGKLSLVDDAHAGRFAARFEAVEHEWGYCAFYRGMAHIRAGATYRISTWAKGRGTISFACYQYSAGGFIGTVFQKGNRRLTGKWQRFTHVYKPTDRRISRAALAIQLGGRPATMWVDDVSVTFDPRENLGIQGTPEPEPTRTLELCVQATDARARLTVNGTQVALVGDRGAVTLREGLAVLGVEAEATGPNPGVAARLVGHPETDERWRIRAGKIDGWSAVAYDDTHWPVAEPGPDGRLWCADKKAKAVCMRQVVLWNRTHYGPNRCIVPPIKQWEFPRGGFDVLHLALYSPLPYRLTDYTFVLEMPAAFRLLDKRNYWQRHITDVKPSVIDTTTFSRDGVPHRRCRLAYSASHLLPDETRYSLLPVVLDRETDLKKCRFRLRREARGNVTELTQTIPVTVLPPVNGRQPKHVMISQYSPIGSYTPVSPAHLEARLAQDATAGCNCYFLPWSVAWGETWEAYLARFRDTVDAVGARLVVAMDFPLNYGGLYQGHFPTYEPWLRAHPEAQGRYYLDRPKWGQAARRSPYCNQYVLNDEGAAFWDLVKKEYARVLRFYPKAELVFSDWEFHNVTKDGSGVHCFCDRCKRAFRSFAKLPADADLSDRTIMAQHRTPWLAFRDRQDGQLIGRMAKISRDLGREYLTYSWASNMGFWRACRGHLDAAFAGIPGNSVADSYYQHLLDDYRRRFRKEVELPRVMGQRFVFFRTLERDGWRIQALSHDGFVHPKSWKTQVLRVVASLHGGVDLQNSTEFCGGIRYYVGEATRIIATFEPLFYAGQRRDDLAASEQIAYPNLLVLQHDGQRLVLLFNEDAKPLRVELTNEDLEPGCVAAVYGTNPIANRPQHMTVTVPPEDVAVVHIRPRAD